MEMDERHLFRKTRQTSRRKTQIDGKTAGYEEKEYLGGKRTHPVRKEECSAKLWQLH